jgi:teichuronic acid biosynthesis glycosyltransferase TuaC
VKIAVVTTSWPRFEGDPSGHFVAAEVRALAQCGEGDEVVVIAAEGAAFGWPGVAARVKESPLRLAGAAAWVAKARAKVVAGRFDRIVAHWAVPCAWPVACADPYATLEVVSHGGDVRLIARMPGPMRERVVRAIAARASAWRFVSQALLDAIALTRVARVAPCAMEVARPSERAIAAKRAEVGAPFAVCVARLVPSKRVDAAIAWAEERRRPLVIVGDGPERESLERAAQASGAQVLFAGRTTRDEALAWIASSAEVVQASRAEGLSTVVREAEALGVRVVAI